MKIRHDKGYDTARQEAYLGPGEQIGAIVKLLEALGQNPAFRAMAPAELWKDFDRVAEHCATVKRRFPKARGSKREP